MSKRRLPSEIQEEGEEEHQAKRARVEEFESCMIHYQWRDARSGVWSMLSLFDRIRLGRTCKALHDEGYTYCRDDLKLIGWHGPPDKRQDFRGAYPLVEPLLACLKAVPSLTFDVDWRLEKPNRQPTVTMSIPLNCGNLMHTWLGALSVSHGRVELHVWFSSSPKLFGGIAVHKNIDGTTESIVRYFTDRVTELLRPPAISCPFGSYEDLGPLFPQHVPR